jgi:hypothetical protein
MASTSGLDSTHPEYDCKLEQWYRCKDVLAGQDAVKARSGPHGKGTCYLPPTAGMILDGMNPGELGYENYQSYKKRALFYGYATESVDLALGMLWNKPPVIEGIKDTKLEYLLTRATHEGETLERLLYRINEAQLGTGRIGILADMPKGETVTADPQPYISIYNEVSITNWDAGYTGQLATESLNMVVLNESGPRRKNVFDWEDWTQYRVLMLGPSATNELDGTVAYRQGIFAQDGGSGAPPFDESWMFAPNAQGRTLDEIPFVFINANSTTSCPQDPPLLSLADLVLHLYRLQADYSAELHGQTSATLVTKGIVKPAGKEKQPQRLGVGGHVDLGSNKEAEAYFLELSGKGLPEMRQSVADAKSLARERSGEIVDQSSRGRESGNSLEQRISVRTATLHSIAQHGAEGLQKLLKIMAKWVGMEDKEIAAIKVTANTVFAKPTFSGIELEALTKAKMNGGAIIPYAGIHAYLVARGFTTQSFEEFKTQWEQDKEIEAAMQKAKAEGAGLTAKAIADAQLPPPKPVSQPEQSGT